MGRVGIVRRSIVRQSLSRWRMKILGDGGARFNERGLGKWKMGNALEFSFIYAGNLLVRVLCRGEKQAKQRIEFSQFLDWFSSNKT